MAKFGEQSAVAKLPKSSRIAYKKNYTFEPPPISPPLSRSRPKFRERCRPLTCGYVPTLVRISCGLPDLFRKESKNVKKFDFSLGFQHRAVFKIFLTDVN